MMELKAELDALHKAWYVKGPYPGYHDIAKSQLLKRWPTLYLTVQGVLDAHALRTQEHDLEVRRLKELLEWSEGERRKLNAQLSG